MIRDNTDIASAGRSANTMVGVPWTDAQTAFLLSHAEWSDDRLVSAISAIGPNRTLSAIKGKRAQLQLPRPPHELSPKDWLAAGYARHLEAQKGWPVMKGEHEERDRQFQRRLWRAQLEMIWAQDVNHSSA